MCSSKAVTWATTEQKEGAPDLTLPKQALLPIYERI